MGRTLFSKAFAALVLGFGLAMAAMAWIVLPPAAYAADEPVASSNAWANSYRTWASPGKSALTVDASGNLERVEYVTGTGLVVETYTTSGKFVSGKTIDASTYTLSDLKSDSAFLWGGVFCGENYNFVVTGQPNYDEDDSLAVMRVTRYSKDWEMGAYVECKAINTYDPFEAGSCAMAESDGVLMLRTCHEMYETSDGYHHQASMGFVFNEYPMKVLAAMPYMLNIWQTSLGYVSHSFDQKLAVLNGTFYSLDLGDAYPRSAVVKKLGSTGTSSYQDVKSISGNTGDNDTYTTIGGLESSSTANTLLAVGTQRDQSAVYSASSYTDYPRNVWLTVVNASGLSVKKQVSLTSYAKGSAEDAENAQIVKTGDNEFLVMWGVKSGSERSRVDYVFVDGDGNIVKSVQSFTGELSDCQPIVTGGKVVWYVTGTYSNPQEPLFYTIDIASRAAVGTGDVTKLSAATVRLSGNLAYTGSAITPGVSVRFGNVVLEEDRDYTLEYENNVNAGTATVKIVGAGTYAGQSVSKNFTIPPADISKGRISYWSNRTYTGSPVEYVASLRVNGATLQEGVDYTVEYENNVNAGEASYTIKAKGPNATGEQSGTFTIGKLDLSKGSAYFADATYTGLAVVPAVNVWGGTLQASDYDISCTNNVNVGTGSATITAKGTNVTGSFSGNFYIRAKKIDDESVTVTLPETVNYTGDWISPKVTVTDSARNKELVEGTDYGINVSDNQDVGTAEVRIWGKGNYTGSATKSFEIVVSASDQKAISAFEDLLKAVPSTIASDSDCAAAIAAQSAYEKLTDLQKSLVSEDDKDALERAGEGVEAYEKAKKAAEAAKKKAEVTGGLHDVQPILFLSSKTVTSSTVKKTAKADGLSLKSVRQVRLLANVKTIKKGAFKGCTAEYLSIESSKLTKKSVKNSLKSAKVKYVYVMDTGSNSKNAKLVAKYKKAFTKANCGKKVTVGVASE